MSRARLLTFATALLAGVGALLWWSGLVSSPNRPPRGVLLLTIDTLRADRLGSYGSTRGLTPHLDALAAEAVRFENAYTVVPLTAPSHASMLTGRYPLAHGLHNNGSEVLPANELLVSEILREYGYRTAGIVSALVLAQEYGLNQGFDLYYEDGIKGTDQGSGLWFNHRRGDLTVDRAITWLKAETDKPFFLWVHLFDPHDPYTPPSPWKERFEKAPYDGEVAFADEQAGRLLAEARNLGLYDDALIVVAADHGEGLGDHKELMHATFVYNSTMHVPLIVRLPGGRGGGSVVTDLASTLDIAPTILDALGIPAPEGIQGVSLIPAARGSGRVPARSLLMESVHAAAAYGWATVRALQQPSWKLIDLPDVELYDVVSDHAERRNMNELDRPRVDEMVSEMNTLIAEVERTASSAQAATIDDETRDRLQSLGYIAGAPSSSRAGRGPDPKRMAFMLTPIKIATNLLNERKYADAEEVFTKVLEVDPDNRLSLMQMAKAMAGQGRFDEASKVFEHAIEVYPDLEEFYRIYGWMLMRLNRPKDAEAVYHRGAMALPESAYMHFLVGYARFLQKDWADAQVELALATELGQRFGKPHYLLAICRLQSGDEPGMLEALEQYLKRDPDLESILNDPYFKSVKDRPAFRDLIRRYL